jgi:hypothetical protein
VKIARNLNAVAIRHHSSWQFSRLSFASLPVLTSGERRLFFRQEDDYCVVRSFRTTPSRGIVSRGDDQFRRLNIIGGAPSIDESANGVQAASSHGASSAGLLVTLKNTYCVFLYMISCMLR